MVVYICYNFSNVGRGETMDDAAKKVITKRSEKFIKPAPKPWHNIPDIIGRGSVFSTSSQQPGTQNKDGPQEPTKSQTEGDDPAKRGGDGSQRPNGQPVNTGAAGGGGGGKDYPENTVVYGPSCFDTGQYCL